MVIGLDQAPVLPMEGALPPDLQGTLLRVGPSAAAGRGSPAPAGPGPEAAAETPGAAEEPPPGALHAVELRDGKAVSYLCRESLADAGVFWHAGAVLALPECGLPSRYTRLLEPEPFAGGLTVPVASHVHRVAADGTRVLFAVDDRDAQTQGVVLRVGEWDASGALRTAQQVDLERATWQHDLGVTATSVVVIESPTRRLEGVTDASGPVPFGWSIDAEMRLGVVPRGGDGTAVRWIRLDPCLVTHVLGAVDLGQGDVELVVCRYDVPEQGQPFDRAASVVGPSGIGLSAIGGSLAVLERWRTAGATVQRTQLDERHVEHPRIDARCEGGAFRHGYCVETGWADHGVEPRGLLKVDVARGEMTPWRPGSGRRPAEPLFVRAADGQGDDEGWILVLVDDPDRGASDLYVLDASELGRRRPEAVVHLPARLPLRSHGEWVPADRYR
ncbi:MAG TPA: carotenoid oxygenase family protein [Acidimicrobiales bacterium]|nr:carotenoid oxygenase family protein [Acidimicrobiales bacterium]